VDSRKSEPGKEKKKNCHTGRLIKKLIKTDKEKVKAEVKVMWGRQEPIKNRTTRRINKKESHRPERSGK